MTNTVERERTIDAAIRVVAVRSGGLIKFDTMPGGGGTKGVVFKSMPALAIMVMCDRIAIGAVSSYASHSWM